MFDKWKSCSRLASTYMVSNFDSLEDRSELLASELSGAKKRLELTVGIRIVRWLKKTTTLLRRFKAVLALNNRYLSTKKVKISLSILLTHTRVLGEVPG